MSERGLHADTRDGYCDVCRPAPPKAAIRERGKDMTDKPLIDQDPGDETTLTDKPEGVMHSGGPARENATDVAQPGPDIPDGVLKRLNEAAGWYAPSTGSDVLTDIGVYREDLRALLDAVQGAGEDATLCGDSCMRLAHHDGGCFAPITPGTADRLHPEDCHCEWCTSPPSQPVTREELERIVDRLVHTTGLVFRESRYETFVALLDRLFASREPVAWRVRIVGKSGNPHSWQYEDYSPTFDPAEFALPGWEVRPLFDTPPQADALREKLAQAVWFYTGEGETEWLTCTECLARCEFTGDSKVPSITEHDADCSIRQLLAALSTGDKT